MQKNISRTDAARINLRWSAAGILFSLIFGSFSRKIFVFVLGKEFVGLSSLMGNMMAVLSLLDFGAAGAVIYRLYAPLAKDDAAAASALLYCYRKICRLSAVVTFAAGTLLLPQLTQAVKGFDDKKTLYIIFGIYIVSNSLGFLFSAERALIYADRKNYVGQIFSYAFGIPAAFAESAVLVFTGSYTAYVALHAAITLAEDAALCIYVRKKYPWINFSASAARKGTFKVLIKEMLYSQPSNIAATLLRTADNFLVVRLFGVAANGVYSNYNMLLSYAFMVSVTPVGAVAACVGNLGAASSPQHAEKVFRRLCTAVFFAVNICTAALFTLSDDVITLWLGSSLALPQGASFAVAAAFFMSGMRRCTAIFRDAYGLYKKERIKPFAELAAFLALSWWLGGKAGIAGVYAGQAASAFFVCLWYEPWVLYKHGFHMPVRRHYALMIKYCAVTALSCLCCFALCRFVPLFSCRAAICLAVPCLFFAAVFGNSHEAAGIFDILKKQLCAEK